MTETEMDTLINRLLARQIPVGTATKTILSCLSEASSANDAYAALKGLETRIKDAIAALELPAATKVDVVAAVKQALREGAGS